jgi:DNA-binding transcriptional regulator YiaG
MKENEALTPREKAVAEGQSHKDNYKLYLKHKTEERLRVQGEQTRAHEAASLKKNVLNLFEKVQLTPEQIAATLGIDVATVREITGGK